MNRFLHICLLTLLTALVAHGAPTLRGSIVDADSGDALPARLYIQSEDGEWHHATSSAPQGSAVPYDVRRGIASTEVHTSLSAHPFEAELPPGDYTLTVERGKEYLTKAAKVTIPDTSKAPQEITLSLKRWANLAEQGWFSGETHTHRKVSELPTLMLAEDLNVTLPLTAWVTDTRQAPSKANKNPKPVPPAKLIHVDPTHVIWPINTEYEIFTVNGVRHTLGAVFVLNHQQAFDLTAPPVTPIAEEARLQNALLDLDKHNWPWSMMLMPTMKVDLFELTNNHLWRTRFLYGEWYPEYAHELPVETNANGYFTERGWIDFGFLNYYMLLNCGFDMKPSAGTASGVHPVPLGFGRVYVKIDGTFSYDKWIEGLRQGRSFVTTGPMLVAEQSREGESVKVSGTFSSSMPLGAIEIVVNGKVTQTIDPQPRRDSRGGYFFDFATEMKLASTSWIAVRGFEDRPDKRPRFAHTAPVHHTVTDRPLRPTRAERAYLTQRIRDELERHQGVLPPSALAEYEKALEFFQGLPSVD